MQKSFQRGRTEIYTNYKTSIYVVNDDNEYSFGSALDECTILIIINIPLNIEDGKILEIERKLQINEKYPKKFNYGESIYKRPLRISYGCGELIISIPGHSLNSYNEYSWIFALLSDVFKTDKIIEHDFSDKFQELFFS